MRSSRYWIRPELRACSSRATPSCSGHHAVEVRAVRRVMEDLAARRPSTGPRAPRTCAENTDAPNVLGASRPVVEVAAAVLRPAPAQHAGHDRDLVGGRADDRLDVHAIPSRNGSRYRLAAASSGPGMRRLRRQAEALRARVVRHLEPRLIADERQPAPVEVRAVADDVGLDRRRCRKPRGRNATSNESRSESPGCSARSSAKIRYPMLRVRPPRPAPRGRTRSSARRRPDRRARAPSRSARRSGSPAGTCRACRRPARRDRSRRAAPRRR